ncbi:MAG TPA: FemAB family XrtA/PEP-CTERM system-associated protein [Gemmatimonadales bacterium]
MTAAIQPDVPDAEWDAYVAAAPDSSFCHLAGWRAVMTEGLGHEWIPLVARDGAGAWQGALPLVRVRSALFGHYLISLPFLNAGGALGTPAARQALSDAAIAEARRSRVDLLEIRSRAHPAATLAVSNRKITVTLDLPVTPEELWERFPAKLRSQIRRPMKAGLDTRFGPEQRDAFYDVLARHMRVLGTPVLPAEFFARIAAALPAQVVFGVVYQRETPVAAGCGFLWRGELEITWASALRAFNPVAPNMLLYWDFMRHAIARGARRFDFGRCTPGGGTHAFKRQWGGRDVALPWGQWTAKAVSAPPSPERPVFRLASACWRRLPLAVTNRLGPRIARHLP